MNRIIKYICLSILILPCFVHATEVELEFNTKIQLNNKKIDNNEFSFKLKDMNGNLLQTKKNDLEGNVKFDKFRANLENNKYYLYTIEQVTTNNDKYIYDSNKAYIRVYNGQVKYFKETPSEIEERESILNKKYKNTPYHATNEELKGQAYAVFDSVDKSLVFFRDEENKYRNYEVIDNKTYYTGFEESTVSVNPAWSSKNSQIKSVMFKDAIKPKSIFAWFYYFTSLETIDLKKLDTSLVTTMAESFRYCGINKLDLRTFDTSNVETMDLMFENAKNIEEIITGDWNLPKLRSISSFLRENKKLEYFDFSVFDDLALHYYDSLGRVYGLKYFVMPKIKTSSEYKVNIQDLIAYNDNLEYVDFSKNDNYNRFDECGGRYSFSANLNGFDKVKIIKLGEGFNPYPDSINPYEQTKGWYSVENNKFFDINNNHSNECNYYPKGTYYQFLLDDTLFVNTYLNAKYEKLTIKITNKTTNIIDYFPDLKNVNDIDWVVEDPSILKIKNNVIIPLKIGESDVTAKTSDTSYRVHITIVEIKNSIIDNPKTIRLLLVIPIIIFVIISSIIVFRYKVKRETTY